MEFLLDTADALTVTDLELSTLLVQVFRDGGFTELDTANTLFQAAKVRERGKIYGAREKDSTTLAGIVIIVPPNSPARRFAQPGEAEMHLLGVKPEYRRNGLAKQLAKTAINDASQSSYSKMLLWTQKTMFAAHRLYENLGFRRVHARDFQQNGRDFWFYDKALKVTTPSSLVSK